jgi:hypothetical protein
MLGPRGRHGGKKQRDSKVDLPTYENLLAKESSTLFQAGNELSEVRDGMSG